MTEQNRISEGNGRNISIDRLRGFAVFVMVFFQLAEHFSNFKVLSRIAIHSPNPDAIYHLPNFTPSDAVISVFLFAIGLTYALSFHNRVNRYGRRCAVKQFVSRYVSIIGIGMILDGVKAVLEGRFDLIALLVNTITLLLLVSVLLKKLLPKKRKAKAGAALHRLSQILLLTEGCIGLLYAFINFLLLCSGVTDRSFGFWVTLHHIGWAGLILLPFVAVPKLNSTTKRFVAGFVMLTIYGIFHEADLPTDLFASNMELLDVVADGGFLGGFAWGAQLLLFTGFADLYFKGRKQYLLGILLFSLPVFAILALVFFTLPQGTTSWAGAYSNLLPINKGSVSPSYIMITTWICLIVFLVFDLFRKTEIRFDVLKWWGKNPIMMYLLEFFFVGGLTVLFAFHFYSAPAWLGVIECIVITGIMTRIAYRMDNKQKYYKV